MLRVHEAAAPRRRGQRSPQQQRSRPLRADMPDVGAGRRQVRQLSCRLIASGARGGGGRWVADGVLHACWGRIASAAGASAQIVVRRKGGGVGVGVRPVHFRIEAVGRI